MHFWRNVLCTASTYGFFFFVPWLGAFRLLAEMADDNAITHWQNNPTLSKQGNTGTFLLAVFLLIIAGQILTFRTNGFPFLVLIEGILVLTYSIGFDITADLFVMILLGFCTLTKVGYLIWKFFWKKPISCTSANLNDTNTTNCKDISLAIPSVNLSLSDMEEIPIENETTSQTTTAQQ